MFNFAFQELNRETVVQSFSGDKYYLVEVIAFILKYLKDTLEKRLARTVYPLGAMDFHWVIAVPNVWKTRGTCLFREAACMVSTIYSLPHQ